MAELLQTNCSIKIINLTLYQKKWYIIEYDGNDKIN